MARAYWGDKNRVKRFGRDSLVMDETNCNGEPSNEPASMSLRAGTSAQASA
jgi:hypothetical protein